MVSHELYEQVKAINTEILTSLQAGNIEKTLTKLRERDEFMQGGLTKLEADIIKRDEVLPLLQEIIKQDSEIKELLSEKIDNLRSSLTSASEARKLRHNYKKEEKKDEPRFLDTKG